MRKFKKFILKILRLPLGYKKHKEIEKSIITIEINIFLQKGHDVLTKIITVIVLKKLTYIDKLRKIENNIIGRMIR